VAVGTIVPPTYKMHFNAELKPFDLSLTNTPPEFRMWKDEMETYFSSNDLKRAPPKVQINYVRKCLDLDLVARVSTDLDTTIPVYMAITGLLALLDKVFETQYPLVTKRLTWASCKQTQGETLDAFINRYLTVRLEAALAKMTMDDLSTYGLLSGLQDSNSVIRQKLMGKQKTEKFEVLIQKAREWSAEKRTSKSFAEANHTPKAAAAVNAVKFQQQSSSPQASSGPRLPPPPAHIKNTPRSIHGKCFVCGDKGHDKYSCPKKESANCSKCSGRHFQQVCLKEYIAWKKTLPGQPQHATSGSKPAQSYARTVTSNPEEACTEKTD
jgi:hypothetical protein